MTQHACPFHRWTQASSSNLRQWFLYFIKGLATSPACLLAFGQPCVPRPVRSLTSSIWRLLCPAAGFLALSVLNFILLIWPLGCKKKKKKFWNIFCVRYKTRLKKKGPDSIPALKSLQSRLDNEAFIEKETWMMQAVALPSCSLPPSVFLVPGSATVCAFSLIVLYLFTLNC